MIGDQTKQHSKWCNSKENINMYKSHHDLFCAKHSPFLSYKHLKIVTLKMSVHFTEYNIRNGVIRWRIHDLVLGGDRNVCPIFFCARQHKGR